MMGCREKWMAKKDKSKSKDNKNKEKDATTLSLGCLLYTSDAADD